MTTRTLPAHLAEIEDAKNPDCPQRRMLYIAKGNNKKAQLALAKNPNLTAEIMNALLRSTNEVKAQLATDNRLTESMINYLLGSSDITTDARVLLRLAKNPNLTPLQIRILATKLKSSYAALTENENCPSDVLVAIYRDFQKDNPGKPNWRFQGDIGMNATLNILNHPNCSTDILVHASTWNPDARKKALVNIVQEYPDLDGLPEEFVLRAAGSSVEF